MNKMTFNYKNDVHLTLGGTEYSVQSLLDLDDEEFNNVYSTYQEAMTVKFANLDKQQGMAFFFTEIAFEIAIMERIVLERRTSKLEKYVYGN